MSNLRSIWEELTFRHTSNHVLAGELWWEIVKSHTAKHRHYHNLSHLDYMMNLALKYEEKIIAPDPLKFSIFYHDIVYEPTREDNEERSANTARDHLTRLGVPPGLKLKCHNHILASKDHKGLDNSDTRYFIDFDLAILGDTREKYREYATRIRQEFSLYPGFLYRKGRRNVLQGFLNKERIFQTDEFHQNFENQARENILAELEEL